MLPVTPSAMAPSAAAPWDQAATNNAQQAAVNDTATDRLYIAHSSAVGSSLTCACGRNESDRRSQAFALGRADTASCQRRTWTRSSGTTSFDTRMKSTATIAVMSATV